MSHDVALGLVALGCSVMVASALGALVTRRDDLDRLHFVTPITSLGAPLAGAGVCVQEGWGLSSAQVIVIVIILFVSGPVLGAATGRLIAQQRGRIDAEGPE